MNGLIAKLKARKRFLCADAMAAAFLLLAGGANALANTVWCVPSASLNSACTSGTTKPHIQDAVTAASAFDVIVVGPGYYNETVFIPPTLNNLSLFGAQAGRDARVGRYNPAEESIVDASGTPYGSGGGAAFTIAPGNVLIDGFTLQGGTAGMNASGVTTTGGNTQILNNIIQNNALGVYLYGGGSSIMEYNLFKTNNAGAAGASDVPFVGMAGFGIGEYHSPNTITENEFEGNLAAAVAIVQTGGTDMTQNTSKNDGSFAVFYNSGGGFFSYNQGRDFGAKGFLPIPLTSPTAHADAAVDVGYESQVQIDGNDLEKGKTPGYNGIAFTVIFGEEPACLGGCGVTNNTIKGFAGDGIVAESSPATGTLFGSGISGNDVEDNGNDGIQLFTSGFNTLVHNEAEGNSVNDCEDDTVQLGGGTGTAGTYNTWFNNIGNLSSPAGLCTPGRRQ